MAAFIVCTRIAALILCTLIPTGCSEQTSSEAPSHVSREVRRACSAEISGCPENTRAHICSEILAFVKDKNFDAIRTYKNEVKREDLTVRCMQYANIYDEPANFLKTQRGFEFAENPHCAAFAKQVSHGLFEACYSESKQPHPNQQKKP